MTYLNQEAESGEKCRKVGGIIREVGMKKDATSTVRMQVQWAWTNRLRSVDVNFENNNQPNEMQEIGGERERQRC